MEYWQILLIVVLPSAIIAGVFYKVLQTLLEESKSKRAFELQKITQKDLIPYKLQAYERTALFLERIKPSALVSRLSPSGDAKNYELDLLKAIQAEFDHNIAQQIYINPDTWKIVYSAKNATQMFIQQSAQDMDENHTAQDFQEHLIKQSLQESIPSNQAMIYLQKDLQSGTF